MTSSSSGRKPLSSEWKGGFLAAHEGLRNSKERSDEDISLYAMAEASHIAERAEGYFRWGYGQDGKHWARYKWSSGPLEGRYTFGSGTSFTEALAQLCGHVHECEKGTRRANMDTGYRNRKVG